MRSSSLSCHSAGIPDSSSLPSSSDGTAGAASLRSVETGPAPESRKKSYHSPFVSIQQSYGNRDQKKIEQTSASSICDRSFTSSSSPSSADSSSLL